MTNIIERAEAALESEYCLPGDHELYAELLSALKAARAEIERLQDDLHIAESQLGLP